MDGQQVLLEHHLARCLAEELKVSLEGLPTEPEDRNGIYRLRHDVFARELQQHEENRLNSLSDSLDRFNYYITATMDQKLVGFISITPPGIDGDRVRISCIENRREGRG